MKHSVKNVIIVGSGSSGSVLASRLSDNQDRHVLVLEAGPAPRTVDAFPPEIRLVSDRSSYAVNHPNNWAFSTELMPDRPWRTPRGRILGGSSAINGAYFIRGLPNDYDLWGPGWSWKELLPHFRRMETDHDFSGPLHGDTGPTPVRRASGALLSPLSTAFIAACQELGFSHEPDKNGASSPGAGLVPSNTEDGLRFNAAFSHLLPQLGRPNLEIRGNAFVRRLVINNGRAVGVEVEFDGGHPEICYADEVVLCAGAFNTPHILLLSGIGPAHDLREAGIEVLVDHPGVGKGWTDDPNLFVNYRTDRDIGFDHRMVVPQAALNYDSGGYPDGDSELLLFVGELLPNSLSMMYGLHQERSRGEMTIVSPNPKTPLRISYNYLSDLEDLRRAREGVRLIVDVLRSRSYRMWCRELIDLDGNTLNDDHTLDLWIHSHLGTTVHAQGSAAMGPDCRTSAVVDHQLRVRGVENLRIVDTSIIPVPLHRGPSATAMVIGEHAATMF